jgi:hypothetical protein
MPQNIYLKYFKNLSFNESAATDTVLDLYDFLKLSPPKSILFADCVKEFYELNYNFIFDDLSSFKSNKYKGISFDFSSVKKISTSLISDKIRNEVAARWVADFRNESDEIRQNLRDFSPTSVSLERVLTEAIWLNSSKSVKPWMLAGDFNFSYIDWVLAWRNLVETKYDFPAWLSSYLKSGIFGISLFDNIAIVLKPPFQIYFNEQGLVHDNLNPSLRWENGFSLYAYKGFAMPSDFYDENPSPKSFLQLKNVTQRMFAVELLGSEKLSRMLKLELLNQENDLCGNPIKLFGGRIPNGDSLKPIKLIEVICPSTFRKFYISVPPTIKSAFEGVAWSFGKTPETYKPNFET